MSDVQDRNEMLENFSRIDYKNDSIQREVEADSAFGGLQEIIMIAHSRSLLHTKSRENSEMPAETVRI